ncbi:MAG: class I SAM-dependent methyltransferase [Thermodesulfobacteriota bacterium]
MESTEFKSIIASPEARHLLSNLFVRYGRAYHRASTGIKADQITSPWDDRFLAAKLIGRDRNGFHLTDLGKTIGYGLLESANLENRQQRESANPVDIPLSPSALFAGKNVVDIGCGTGCYTALARRLGAKTAIGMDVQQPLLQTARLLHRDSGALFVSGSAEHLPLPDTMADLVILRGILAYVDNHKLLQEVSRISRPGCQIMLTTQGCGYFAQALLSAGRHLHVFHMAYLSLVLLNGLFFTLSGRRLPLRIKKYFSRELISIFHTKASLFRLVKDYGYTVSSCRSEKIFGMNSQFCVMANRQ